MSEATDKLILAQLKRIADALDRAHPKPNDIDFGQVSPRFTEPAHTRPIRVGDRPGYGTYVAGEGDWQLQNDNHTGEETE